MAVVLPNASRIRGAARSASLRGDAHVAHSATDAAATGMRGWLDTFANPFLAGVAGAERENILDEVTSLLAPSLRGRTGAWTADYVRLRFAARLER